MNHRRRGLLQPDVGAIRSDSDRKPGAKKSRARLTSIQLQRSQALSSSKAYGFTLRPRAIRAILSIETLRFGPFNTAEIGAVDARLMGQRLLAETTLRSKATHIPGQNVP